jgi:hypothetical protein
MCRIMSNIKIVIPKDEIIETIEHKTVSPNGQISLGRKHAGKIVTVYVVVG